ncbi:MarR family winged helix-turn-helix transcriptional regulator [Azorhizobium doebereinerae]|uniref:MarR family winged helix-turn-helix transcriptional regulator n=1 Tax=Azorhizobium doebereinerae TaxID=281091 RepID=UPI00040D8BFA|nr:MarR family winged helix-turn-helix transcriptional regulator [Azorhizobium doebereinerae]
MNESGKTPKRGTGGQGSTRATGGATGGAEKPPQRGAAPAAKARAGAGPEGRARGAKGAPEMAAQARQEPPALAQRRQMTVSKPELMMDGSDRAFRQLVHDTLAFAARIQEVRSRLGALIGLSGAQYTILVAVAHLQDREAGVGVNLLAEHLHLSGAFVTIEVNKLVAAELVSKEVNPEDRRRVLLTITEKAGRLLDELTTVQRPANDTLFDCLTADEFHALRSIVSRLVTTGDRTLKLLEYLAPDGSLGSTPAPARD